MSVSVGPNRVSISLADSPIHFVDRIPARGPQKSNSGNSPSLALS